MHFDSELRVGLLLSREGIELARATAIVDGICDLPVFHAAALLYPNAGYSKGICAEVERKMCNHWPGKYSSGALVRREESGQ